VASFLAILVADFLTHAVALSSWWRNTETYWRAPPELFRLIPYAYAAFALYAAGLNWLLVAIKGPRPLLRTAITLGATSGAFIGLTTILGIYSVLSVPHSALLVFPASFAFSFAAAGTSAALVLAAPHPWRRLVVLAFALLLAFALGVIAQNLLFPTPSGRRVPAPVALVSQPGLAPSCAAA